MPEVIVVGAMMTDLMTYLPGDIPDFGGSTNVDKFLMGFGGKGGNQAAMTGYLDASVAFIGRLGNDMFGKSYLEHFQQIGIDTSSIVVSDTAKTGVAQIMVNDFTGQNSITAYFGANKQLSADDIRKAESKIAAAKCLVVSFEIPIEAALEALQIAKKYGVTTLVNMAPTEVVAKLRTITDFDDFLRQVDIVCPNEYEAEALTGLDLVSSNQDRTNFRANAARVVEHIHNETIRVGNPNAKVMVTLGEAGVAYWNTETSRVEFVDARRVKAVDTTGAGDSFVGSLAYFIVRHPELPLGEKIRRASYIATESVLKPGTQCSFPKLNELPKELFE